MDRASLPARNETFSGAGGTGRGLTVMTFESLLSTFFRLRATILYLYSVSVLKSASVYEFASFQQV